MTSKLIIPKISKVNKMAERNIRDLVGTKMSRDVKFMGSSVKINKLLVSQVLEIQGKAKSIKEDDAEGFEVLKLVIRLGLEGGSDLTDEDFGNLPLAELSNLSTEIMKFSGMGEQGK